MEKLILISLKMNAMVVINYIIFDIINADTNIEDDYNNTLII